jgi:hypothetical protein
LSECAFIVISDILGKGKERVFTSLTAPRAT